MSVEVEKVSWRAAEVGDGGLAVEVNVLKVENLLNGRGGHALLGDDSALHSHDVLTYHEIVSRERQDGENQAKAYSRRDESGEEEDERKAKDGLLDPARLERLGFPRTKHDEDRHSKAEEAGRSL